MLGQALPVRNKLGARETTLTDAYLPQVQGLAAVVARLRLIRGAGGWCAGAVQHQDELGQSA